MIYIEELKYRSDQLFMVAERCLIIGYRFLPLESHSFIHFSA